MSSKLKPVDLSSAGVGFTATIDFNQFLKFLPNDPRVKAHIRILNESGCGLDIAFQASGNTHNLPAGAWGTFDLEPNDGSVLVSVTYTLPNPPVSLLLSIYYAPGETVPQAFTLGNSPIGIGGSITTSSVQTLSNEANAANTLVLDIGDTALSQLITLFTDHFVLKVDQSGVAHAVIKGSTTGNAAQIGQVGDTSEVLGNLLVDGQVTINGLGTALNVATGAFVVSAGNSAQFTGVVNVAGGFNLTGGDMALNTHNISSVNNIACNGTISLNTGSIGRLTVFNGTGNVSINTGLGINPTTVFGNPCTVSGSSQTIGYTNTQTSTVTTGAGFAWNGTALKT